MRALATGPCRGQWLLASSLLLLMAGCTGVGGVRPADVAVYQVFPPHAYEFVATVRTDAPAPTRGEALAELRERAAEVGANAVIVNDRGASTGPLRGIAVRVQR